ncbi:MAG: phosphodiester glycosidase family protein [Bryobacterales bacterium]|nr:phosphodiester glycosidase family protein [Bryobacterales bacterium]
MRWLACFLLAGIAWSGESVDHPFAGVTLIRRQLTEPRAVTLFVVEADLTNAGISFLLTPPAAAATPHGRETLRQTTLEFLRSAQAQLAVNAHFFVPFPAADPDSDLIGLAASAGKVYSRFEDPQQSYAIVARAPALNLDAANRARIVREGDAVAWWNALSGSAQVVTGGRVTVPRYEAGALTPGGPARYDNDRSWYETPNARTLIGLDREARRLMLLVIDTGTAQSRGMTVTEAAELLVRDYGAYDALNLDGGGSTTLAMADPKTGEAKLVNRPSGGGVPRAVGSSLAVFAKPLPRRR